MQLLHFSFLVTALFSLCNAHHNYNHRHTASRELAAVVRKFEEYKIPEELGIIFQPRVQLHVLFPQNTTNTLISVTPGEQLQRNETALAPSYRMTGEAGTDGPFLIVMVDPDAPTPQNRSYSLVRHFMGGNYVVSHGKGSRRHRHHLIMEHILYSLQILIGISF